MISVEKAKDLINKNAHTLQPIILPIADAADHILAENMFALVDIPAFQQSSMDGYAFSFLDKNIPLTMCGEMAAGTKNNIEISRGKTTRIFTGAPLPQGADTVVMQEKVILKNGQVIIEDISLIQGNNVRNKGAEIKAGALALSKYSLLSPAAIGFLAGIGFNKILVYPMPIVSIIVTGKELQKPGTPLSFGQVYESNSYALTSALRRAGIKQINVCQVDDDLEQLKNELSNALALSDIVLLTGGVSVGTYDFVVAAAGLCGVQQLFHKVKQKPGKPLFFGIKNNKLVFGLPGNPGAVLSCFYNYVLLAIEKISSKKSSIIQVEALLTKNYAKQIGITQFLKGIYTDGKATPLSSQESFQLSSFAHADCLICLEEAHGDYIAGENVNVYLLPT